MSISFRPARLPDDAALLLDLNTEYLQSVFDGVAAAYPFTLADVFPGGNIRAYLTGALDKVVSGAPGSAFYIVEVDGQVAGMGGLRAVRPGIAEMKRVYVRPAFRGARLGLAIVDRLMADARGFGYSQMFLDTAPTLKTAIALYQRLGFADIPPYPEVEVSPLLHPIWVFMGRDL